MNLLRGAMTNTKTTNRQEAKEIEEKKKIIIGRVKACKFLQIKDLQALYILFLFLCRIFLQLVYIVYIFIPINML